MVVSLLFFLAVTTFLEEKKLVKYSKPLFFSILVALITIIASKVGSLEDFDFWLFVGFSTVIIVLDVITEKVFRKLKIDY
jgi:hypothetical protein